MAIAPCAYCKHDRGWNITYSTFGKPSLSVKHDRLDGVFTCDLCGKRSVFEMEDSTLMSLPGKLFVQDINTRSVPQIAQHSFVEAEASFYGHAYMAAVGMCRSALEESLADKNIKTNRLEDAIADAKASGILQDEQVTWATS